MNHILVVRILVKLVLTSMFDYHRHDKTRKGHTTALFLLILWIIVLVVFLVCEVGSGAINRVRPRHTIGVLIRLVLFLRFV